MHRRSSFELDERAAAASAILDSDLVKEVLEAMKVECFDKLIITTVGGDEAREAHAMLKAVEDFRNRLYSVINDKKIAQAKGNRYG